MAASPVYLNIVYTLLIKSKKRLNFQISIDVLISSEKCNVDLCEILLYRVTEK